MVARGGRQRRSSARRHDGPAKLQPLGATDAGETPHTTSLDERRPATWLRLRGVDGELLVSRVLVQGASRGAVLAVTEGPPRPGVVAGLDTLAAQLALALESVALTEDLHVRQSEARFRALVQNSSDAILLIDADTVVRYQSPSVERVLGFPSDGLIGRSPARPRLLGRGGAGARILRRVAHGSRASARRIELRLERNDGTWIDAEAVGNNLEQEEHVGGHGRDDPRHQRAEAVRAPAQPPGLPRRAHRPGEPRAVQRPPLARTAPRKSRDDSPLAVVLLDLDDFKLINDSLGHAAGDAVLVAVAERLRHLFRPGDTTARLGGDEFAIALESLTQEEGAFRAVERAIAVLREPLVVEGKEVFVQASAGIAFADDGAVTTEELLRNADVAMYVAKTEGKGRYAVYESRMHAAALQRLDLRADLQRALDNRRVPAALPAHRVPGHRRAPSASRRWCAGSTPSEEWCRRGSSSPWPRRPASSCRSADGSSTTPASRPASGSATGPEHEHQPVAEAAPAAGAARAR